MDIYLYKKIIDECSNYKNIERIIAYMNNEPLTDPYLIERIDYAKDKVPWACIHIVTNGLLLSEDISEKLLNSKLDWIGISFHGIRQQTVEKTMGIPFKHTLDRINNFIDKAKEKKNLKDYIMVTFLGHKYMTPEERDEAISYWKNKGIERIDYYESPISRAGNVEGIRDVYNHKKIIGCNTMAAEDMMHISDDGKAILCCMDWRKEVVLGDINNETIYQVWNGKKQDTWQMIYGEKPMPDNFLCKKCEEAKLAMT